MYIFSFSLVGRLDLSLIIMAKEEHLKLQASVAITTLLDRMGAKIVKTQVNATDPDLVHEVLGSNLLFH